ncbi:exodeoxyribonuclease VII large subunit [Halonotius sp. GCM10025705]|uniref:exodeoxyribonuclease VII large subunit n=1 Tax=Halonotius sp. GCM10025705 TaxID=3252678 RepID=UPI00361E350B
MVEADGTAAGTVELDSDDIVTVATLNDEIAAVIDEKQELTHDYVVGDASDCREANGHLHFDLVSGDASIHCVVFGFRYKGLNAKPDEEMHVAVRGELSYYEPQGSCSLIVEDVVNMGESEYSQVYAENKEKLADDGLLDDEQKQTLPELPTTVGLVTSADSDARIDAVTAIHDRYPQVDIKINDASVQGPDALEELMSGVSAFDKDATVDVIVVTRGGGADKTLRIFNETPICRVIADTDTPTAVGIGHEDDQTLADEVADYRFMTPTHAGEVVPKRADLDKECAQLSERLDTAYLSTVNAQLTASKTALDNAYEGVVASRLQELEASLANAADRHVEAEILELRNQLDTAYQALEQEKEHEEELEETVEEVRDEALSEAEAKVARQQRRYKIAIAVLVLVVLGLAALYLIP